MASYSNYYQFGSGPSMGKATKGNVNSSPGGFTTGGIGDVTYNVVNGPQQDQKAADAFDALMAGHDATSASYVQKLQSIYDGYGKYAADFGDKAQPIIDSLSGDITEMQGYIKDYGANLDEIKPIMMDGINVDPSATRTREEYQGNVAAAYAKQQEQQKQSMESQGMNPYANTGASRAASLGVASAMSDAGNKAYSDWRTQYNSDIQAKQKGQAEYAGLLGQKGAMQASIMQGRGVQLNANKSILDAKIGAGQAQAAGVTDLLSLAESRRQEALALGQQQQQNAMQNTDITQQLNAKLTGTDRWAAGL